MKKPFPALIILPNSAAANVSGQRDHHRNILPPPDHPLCCDEDMHWMRLALQQAHAAGTANEVPVGAVLIDDGGTLLAAAGNNCITAADPVGHAEIRAIRGAAQKVGNYRLPRTTLYVTLEPCAMCASAMIHARVSRVVFGAADPKAGAITSKYSIGTDGLLNHTLLVTGGVLAEESAALLKDFFKKRRGG